MIYQKRISGPLLDRIDIHTSSPRVSGIDVPRVEYEKLSDARLGESSASVQERVEAARDRQRVRFGSNGITLNAEMHPADIRKFCALDATGQTYFVAMLFEEGQGTNPEELVGTAHAGCFSQFLAALLSNAGFVPTRIRTTATVHLRTGPTIALIELKTEAEVPNISEAAFLEHAEAAKKNCPVSKALAAVEITLNAKLVN